MRGSASTRTAEKGPQEPPCTTRAAATSPEGHRFGDNLKQCSFRWAVGKSHGELSPAWNSCANDGRKIQRQVRAEGRDPSKGHSSDRQGQHELELLAPWCGYSNFWNGSMTKSPCKKQKSQNSPWIGGGVDLGRVRQRSGSAPAPAPSPEGSCQGSHHPTELPARPGCSPPAQGTAGSLRDFCLETASDGGRPGGSEGGTRRGQSRQTAGTEGMGKGWKLGVFEHGKVLSRIYPKVANLH